MKAFKILLALVGIQYLINVIYLIFLMTQPGEDFLDKHFEVVGKVMSKIYTQD